MTQTGELLLAVDLGTTLTKAVVFDTCGAVVGSASRGTPIHFSAPTRAECDAERLWQVAAECIRAALATTSADRVVVVGVCGFMHSLIAVDGSGLPLHPQMLWSDQRSAPQVDQLGARAGSIAAITGKRLTTLSSLPRLLWLRANAPQVLTQARSFLLSKDFVRLKLTGELGTDPWDAAGTGLLEASSGGWSAEILDIAGLATNRMPPIRPPDETAGLVTVAAASATGLRPGTPVIIGTGDWPATLIGSGCHLPSRTCFYLGSAGILGSFASARALDTLGTTCHFGSVTSTGTALRWIRDLVYHDQGQPRSYEALFADAGKSEPGARELMFLPHLMGERGGAMRPHARGALYGLTLAHGRADLVRSVLEGTILWLRVVSEQQTAGREIGDLMIYGGGARSPLWRQICAAVFGRPMLLPDVTEGAALGVAMLGGVNQGIAAGYLELGRRWVTIARSEKPDPHLRETYDRLYTRYQTLETTLAVLDHDPQPQIYV